MEPRQSRATEPAGPDAPAARIRALRGPMAARALESISARFNALPAWARWVLIGGLLAGAWAAVWASGGTARAMPHLFYIPILTGAYFFRWPGALVTGVLASILCGPLLPLLVEPYTPQTTQSWVLRSAFFLGIGALAAAALAAQSRAEEREITQDLLSQLQFEVRGPVDTALVPLVAEVLEARAFHTVMQPVYSLHDGRLMGVEALTRFDRGPARPPDRWFAAADSLGLGTDLELAAIAGALKAGATLPSRVVLSVNASPATLADPRLLDLLRTRRHTAVTVEITEHAVVEDYPLLRDVVDKVRELGVRIAVDDAGAGVASMHHIVQLGPDAIKLDASLTQDMSGSALRRSLATAMVEFAYRANAQLIVEGIETESDLAAWRSLGAHGVQGNYTGRATRHTPALFCSKVVSARVAGPRFPVPRRATGRLA